MQERQIYAVTLVALLVLSGLGLALSPGSASSSPAKPYHTTADGVRYTVHPSELEQGCLTGRDCIQSIDDPTFSSGANATWLQSDELVIGVTVDGETKAYPLVIMRGHEIVNDRIAGRPIAVTYCPLCRSGIVFSRRVGDRTLTFGVSGKLLEANLVMYDRATGTYWSQLKGEAIVGPLVPRELEPLPSTITTWGEWRREHPDTRVLTTAAARRDIGGRDPYRSYRESDRVGYGVGEVDDRLNTKAIVYGVSLGNAAKAYPKDALEERRVINDELAGIPIVVLKDPADGSVRVFVRELDNRTYRFAAADGTLHDGAGNKWSFEGEALDGPAQGQRLRQIPVHGFYWFAWSSFHPETEIYRSER